MVRKIAILFASAMVALTVLPSLAQVPPVDAGARAFLQRCASCHGRTAAGNPGVYPPLFEVGRHAGSDAGRTYLAGAVAVGVTGKIEVGGRRYSGYMPGLRATTSAKERADILNWLIRQNKSRARPFDAKEIERREALLRTPGEVGRARPGGS